MQQRGCAGLSVVVRRGWTSIRCRAWLPAQALQELGEASPLVIDELGGDEVTQLREADPALAALLRPGHPAEKLVRNLYRLDRLSAQYGGRGHRAIQRSADGIAVVDDRRRGRSGGSPGATSRASVVGSAFVASSAPMDTRPRRQKAVTALTESGSLHALSSVHVEPAHDVLRDWAIGCLLMKSRNTSTQWRWTTRRRRVWCAVWKLPRGYTRSSVATRRAWRALLDR